MQPESNRSGNLQTKETTDHHTAGSLLMRNGEVQSLIFAFHTSNAKSCSSVLALNLLASCVDSALMVANAQLLLNNLFC
jgi:hypothetical protein